MRTQGWCQTCWSQWKAKDGCTRTDLDNARGQEKRPCSKPVFGIRVAAQVTWADYWATQNNARTSLLSARAPAVARAVITCPSSKTESPHEAPASLKPSPHGTQHPLPILRAGEGFTQMEFIMHDKASIYLLWCNYHFTAKGCKSFKSTQACLLNCAWDFRGR